MGLFDAASDFADDIFGTNAKVELPAPSPQELALIEEQQGNIFALQDLFQQQTSLSQSLLPLSLQAAGLNPVFDDSGRVTGVSSGETPEEQRRDELRQNIELGFLERTDAALRGELPVNPALLSDLGRQERDLREELRKSLGPDYATSSPGIEALGLFGQTRNETLEQARRGDLSLGQQLALSQGMANEQFQNIDIAQLLGFNQYTAPLANQGSQFAGILSNAISGFRADRGLALNRNINQENLRLDATQERNRQLLDVGGFAAGLFL